MPKGGAEKYEKQINTDRAAGIERYGANQARLEPQYNQFWQNYGTAVDRQTKDYGNFMGRYNEFADTGGFSPQDIQNMRSRAMSPLRATYAAAQRNLGRNLSPGGAAGNSGMVMQGRLAREQGQSMADVSRATEADIAELRQKGRLAGIGGMVSGYGATPGQAQLYGNQALAGSNQLLQNTALQNDFINDMLTQQGRQATMPGKWQTAFNNILAGGETAGRLLYPWLNKLKGAGGTAPIQTAAENASKGSGVGNFFKRLLGLGGGSPGNNFPGPGGTDFGGGIPQYPQTPNMYPPDYSWQFNPTSPWGNNLPQFQPSIRPQPSQIPKDEGEEKF